MLSNEYIEKLEGLKNNIVDFRGNGDVFELLKVVIGLIDMMIEKEQNELKKLEAQCLKLKEK